MMLQGVLLAIVVIAGPQEQGTPPRTEQGSTPRTAAPTRVDAEPDDIIVEGYRDRTDIQTSVAPAANTSGALSRTKYAFSERIAKCAARARLTSLDRLRAVVDGEVSTATYRMAQDRLVRTYITCSEGTSLIGFTSPPRAAAGVSLGSLSDLSFSNGPSQPIGSSGSGSLSDGAPLGWSIYDRGAFTVQALRKFVPDLRLTRKDTGDAAVQARFNRREVPRNRWRSPADYRYFEVAVCMVRVEPRLAVRLAMSDGPASLGDTQAALIDRARICVGGARNVRVDPTQFRLYVADAVYRWAVAARNVETLIPDA